MIGIETSIGIGSWVRNPRELCMSYALAKKGIQCRYLLGGNLLMDMEEEKTDKELFYSERNTGIFRGGTLRGKRRYERFS